MVIRRQINWKISTKLNGLLRKFVEHVKDTIFSQKFQTFFDIDLYLNKDSESEIENCISKEVKKRQFLDDIVYGRPLSHKTVQFLNLETPHLSEPFYYNVIYCTYCSIS